MEQKELNEKFLYVLLDAQGVLNMGAYTLNVVDSETRLSMTNVSSENLTQTIGLLGNMVNTVQATMLQVMDLFFSDNKQEKSLSDTTTQAAPADAD